MNKESLPQDHAKKQAAAQLESIAEMVAALTGAKEADDSAKIEEVERAILEDPLTVQVRSGWHCPHDETPEIREYNILLCTGGPAVRIIGDLDSYHSPYSARLEYQDWGIPWTTYFLSLEEGATLLTYCQQFYFGE